MVDPIIFDLQGLANSTLLLLVAIGIFVGIMIGSIGIGGVLLVPTLVYLASYDVHIAIASCMLSYTFSGLIGAWIYMRKGTIRWTVGGWLSLGAMPGAGLGALTVQNLPTEMTTLVIALFVLFAAYSSIRMPKVQPERTATSPVLLMLTGLLVGFGSATSGTGGPLLLVPILIWFGWPALSVVGLSQMIQVPIGLVASLANFHSGKIDLLLGMGIAGLITLGVIIGARVAHFLPLQVLRNLVVIALSIVGCSMLIRATLNIIN